MPSSPLSLVFRQLRAAAERGGAGRTDGELLTDFLGRRDEDALAALVGRHAPMVWGVCCRVLRNPRDAEDAFQATFLVLVQKAAAVVPRELVANWLYGVARQTAVRLRAEAAKRGGREVSMHDVPEPPPADARDDELLSLLDLELGRLPERFRALVVLCDLEGHTRKDVARRLGCPEGTVASGLARARALLAKRLTRRGVVFSGGSVAAAVLSGSASGAAPPALVVSTITAACLLAAGEAAATGAISVKVAALTNGVVKAMFMTKLKSAIAVVLAFGVAGAGGTSLAYRMAAGQDGKRPATDRPTSRTAAVQDGKKPGAEKPQEGDKPSSKDLSKIEPPGGVPLPLVEPGTNKIGVDQLSKVRERLQSAPEKGLEQWVVELERITDAKLKDGLPSPRGACRTDFAVRLSVAFDDLRWNATAADELYQRARTMQAAEAKAWKEAFESLLKEKIGIEQTGKDEFSNLPGGPPWAVPLVLVPVDALHEGQKYSVERGQKYLARLKQLGKDDVALWRDKVDKFGGTDLDAAVNIILLDEFFSKEEYQRDRFKAAVERQEDKKPATRERVQQGEAKGKEIVTAWGTEAGGLQAGLGLLPGAKRSYRHGEAVTLVVRVRNVGKGAVKFEYVKQFLDENRPAVTDSGGKNLPQSRTSMLGIHGPTEVSLEPGQEVVLETRMHGASGSPYRLLPAGGGGKVTTKEWPLFVGTGKVGLQYERVIGNSSSGFLDKPDPALGKLATGKLELEVTDEPPVAEKKPTGVAAKPKPGARRVYTPDEVTREKYDAAATRTVEFKVVVVAKPTEVKQSPGEGAPWVIGHSPDDVSLLPYPPRKIDETEFSVVLTSKVVEQLKRIGIKDSGKHFDGKTIRVSGRIRQHRYTSDDPPEEPHFDLVIEDVSQFEAVD